MRYNSSYYTKEKFIEKFQKLLDERYADKAEHKRRSEFCTEYDNKFKTKDGKSITQAVKQWFSLGNNNTRKPSIEKLMNICELLNCDIDYFLTEQTDFKKDIAPAAETTGLSYKAIENLNTYSNSHTSTNTINLQLLNLILSSDEIYNNIVTLLSKIVYGMDYVEIKDLKTIYDFYVMQDRDDTKKYFSDATYEADVTYNYNGKLYYNNEDNGVLNDALPFILTKELTKLNMCERMYRDNYKGNIEIIADKNSYLIDEIKYAIDNSKIQSESDIITKKDQNYNISLTILDVQDITLNELNELYESE